jgi:small subunit ribosomal protein S1
MSLQLLETDVTLKIVDENEEDYLESLEQETWETINAAKQNRSILKGMVSGFERIGDKLCAVIMIGRVKGLLPQEFSGYGEDERAFRNLVNRETYFKVLNTDQNNNIFTASRILAIEHLTGITWDMLRTGQIVEATIIKVKMKEMRIEIGGIEVTLKAPEISYEWIDDLRERFKINDKINVKVMEVDKKEKKLVVSPKALMKDPYPDCARRYVVGGDYRGKVTGTNLIGVYVNLEPGVDLMTPLPDPVIGKVKKGDHVLVRLKKVDVQARKITGRIINKF